MFVYNLSYMRGAEAFCDPSKSFSGQRTAANSLWAHPQAIALLRRNYETEKSASADSVVAAALLLLAGLGAYWPSLVDANSATAPLGPEATIGDAVTYQGYVTDENGVPLNGTFSMRFQIYNAQAGGTLLWDSGNSNIAVNDGLVRDPLWHHHRHLQR